jgi:hypothetical protein
MPPEQIATAVRLVRLPLRPRVVDAVQRRLVRMRPAAGPLELAHELGDLRFAERFAPARRGAGEEERWNGALAVFGIANGPAPAVLGCTIHTLDALSTTPLPHKWAEDPIDWPGAQEALLLPRPERRVGLAVPFAAEVWPKVRIVDPGKPPTGKRRKPRARARRRHGRAGQRSVVVARGRLRQLAAAPASRRRHRSRSSADHGSAIRRRWRRPRLRRTQPAPHRRGAVHRSGNHGAQPAPWRRSAKGLRLWPACAGLKPSSLAEL